MTITQMLGHDMPTRVALHFYVADVASTKNLNGLQGSCGRHLAMA
jgi:hypothetical protein